MHAITSSERIYVRTASVRYLRDADPSIERIEFHVRAGDYFAMLAGALGFVEEALKECASAPQQQELVRGLRKDLVHLHKKYRIVPASSEKKLPATTINRLDARS